MDCSDNTNQSSGISSVIGLVVVIAFIVLLVASFTILSPSEGTDDPSSDITVTWIDVGQADSILIQSENGDTMLIDTGDFTDDGEIVLDYLDRNGVNRIDHLVSSHQDADHIGGHEAVIREFGSEGIGNVYDNGVSRGTETADEYVSAVLDEQLSITEVERGDSIPFEGAKVKVLNPKNVGDSGSEGSENDVVVLKLVHGDNSFLFTGDIESRSESRIVDSTNVRADVMHVPHHGSSTSSTDVLLNEVNPEVAVISSPFDSQFGHPDPEVVSRYENRGTKLFWTATNGNVTVRSDGSNIETTFERGEANDVTNRVIDGTMEEQPADDGEDSTGDSNSTNILENPSFERGVIPNALMWTETRTANSGLTEQFSLDGNRSIVMKDLTAGYGGRTLKSDLIRIQSDETYSFGASYRLPSTESDFSNTNPSDYRYKVELAWFDSSGNEIGDEQVVGDASSFDSWIQITGSATPPEEASRATLRVDAYEDMDRDGNIYWDSAFIRP